MAAPTVRPVRVRMRRPRRGWRRLLPPRRAAAALAAVAALLVLVAAATVRETLALRSDALAGEQGLRAARAVLDTGTAGGTEFRLTAAQLDEARAGLDRARSRIESAQGHAATLRPMLWLAARLPGWPNGAAEVGPLLETSRLLAVVGENLTAGLAPLVQQVDGGGGDTAMPAGTRLAAAFTDAEPHLRIALHNLDRAQAQRATVDEGRLRGPLAPAAAGLREFDREWPSLRADLLTLAELAPAARVVLGMDRPRTYAILGQNSTELRPTGGFIGSLGIVTLDGGRVTQQDYRSSYDFDNRYVPPPPAPAPLAQHLGVGWVLRDANWSPDFPTSAKTVEAFLGFNQGIAVDGVIAFDTYAVGEILRALGPVVVPGFPEPVTADQWYALATDLIYGDPAENYESNKGQVLGPMLRAVSDRLQNARAGELPDVLRALRNAVAGRHILLYFHDPAPAALARRHGADGRIGPAPGTDTLYVVDANLSYSKVGPYIREQITYEASLSPRGVATESHVTVAYQNTVTPEVLRGDPFGRIGGAEWDDQKKVLRREPGLLGTYLRVYAPGGSRLLDAGGRTPGPVQEDEAGLTSFGEYVRVPAGAAARVDYTYQVPVDLAPRGVYRLRVLKQPGTEGHDLEVRLKLPPGARLRSVSPELRREGDSLVFRGRLTENLDFSVAFERAHE